MAHSTPPSHDAPTRGPADSPPATEPVAAGLRSTSLDQRRRSAPLWGLALIAIGLAVIPLDPIAVRAARAVSLAGDLRRELELLQQFGAPASILIAALLIASLDPQRFRRFLDLLLAAGVMSLTALAGKVIIGRPRPRFDDPFAFNGFWNAYPIPRRDDPTATDLIHSFQLGADRVEQLWSMPSSHTTAAVTFAVFLAVLYPRLRLFAVGMAALVASCRVLFGAHYPSDVLVGAGFAVLIATPLIRSGAGVRLLDAIWLRFIDKDATPAWPRMNGAPD